MKFYKKKDVFLDIHTKIYILKPVLSLIEDHIRNSKMVFPIVDHSYKKTSKVESPI